MSKTKKNTIRIDPVTQWISEHSEEVNQFIDEYIGIDANNFRIVASGSTSTEVFTRAHDGNPNIEIIMFKVPPTGLSM